ncbi:MAG TPA: cation-transporting P-type ATPase [Rubrobacter sp.]|nr:cation-transporting P-type ATPase [Rubrobacter sp.]
MSEDARVSLDPEERLDLLLGHLGTRRQGLSEREAARRLEQHGPNEIRRRKSVSRLSEFARQFTHPLALLLWAAAALAFVGGTLSLSVAIVGVIVLNAVFAFFQELQAEKATEALKQYLPPHARVRRAGGAVEVEATTLVPGDVLLLSEGDRLSADARLIDGSVEVDMSALTGESQPVARGAVRFRPASSPLESDDLLFGGTLVTGGEAEAVVYATGMATQFGRIATLTQRVKVEVSPLQLQVNRAARLISFVAVGAGVLFLTAGAALADLPLADALLFAIGLLVANVPEGLLPTITLALAVGVRRMARRRALLKRLTAVETLGSTDVICTDKTGTLTEGRMILSRFWADGKEMDPKHDGSVGSEPLSGLLRTAVRCSNAGLRRANDGWERTGDPSESALLAAAALLGEDVERAQEERGKRRRRLYHFDARVKRMTTADEEPDGSLWYHVKGAPLELLERCTSVRGADGDKLLTDEDRRNVHVAFERYAGEGLRVLGFAEKKVSSPEPVEDRDDAESKLTFLGLAALEDPPRPDVADAVSRCLNAGIRIIVVTGDHGLTAEAVARRVGIVRGSPRIISGSEVDAMHQHELDTLLRDTPELIVARSNPETKLHVVDALRTSGHTVAMTGDGVNDAPALRRADIGVAMGASGTEVARESATMVLTDDSFASIVAAVEEGRVVYDNIRKFVTYIFAHATPEVVPFLIYALSGGAIPLPLTVMQILAIDLGTETLPALALGREPAEPGVMQRPPRPRDRGIIDRPMLARAWGTLGLVEAALVTGGFFFVLYSAGWSPGEATGQGSHLHGAYLAATTMTFAGITACQVGTAFATRTSHASLREIGVFSNRLLLWGILFELVFAAMVIYLPPLQAVFGTHALGLREVALLAIFPFVVWGTDEIRRWTLRRRERQAEGIRETS